MTLTPAIAFRNLTKRYGAFAAVSDLTLEIEEGSICGLLGPNGAGKSTAFKCLLGLVRPTSGNVYLGGKPLEPATFESLAYVPEKSALYEWMTVAEHLNVYRRSYRNYDAARVAELLALFRLDTRKKVSKLSKGQRTAVMLVLALSYHPRILILDEPSSGLDPVFQRAVLDLIIDAAANGATVLFSSHQVGQVERAADRVAVVQGGRLVLDGNVDSLKGSSKIVEAVFDGTVPELNGLANDARITRIDRSGRMLRAYVTTDSEAIAAMVRTLGPRNVAILDLSLEDIFFNAVGADRAPAVGEQ